MSFEKQSDLAMRAQLHPAETSALVRKALAESGSVARAAAALGVSVPTLYRVVRRLGLEAQMPRHGKGPGRPEAKKAASSSDKSR
jgi:transposase-like protein